MTGPGGTTRPVQWGSMPTYEYACLQCERHIEVYQSFSEEPLSTCPHCGGVLRKVFHPAGILFRGSGFYKTDSRSGAKSGARDGGESSSSSSKKSDSKSDSKGSRDSGGSRGSEGSEGSGGSRGSESSGGPKQPAPAGGSKGQSG